MEHQRPIYIAEVRGDDTLAMTVASFVMAVMLVVGTAYIAYGPSPWQPTVQHADR